MNVVGSYGEKWEKGNMRTNSGLGVMMGLVLNLPPESISFFLKGEAVYNTSIKPYGELTPCDRTSWNPFEGPGIDIN